MRLGKIGYYGDFFVYPVAIGGLAAYAIWTTGQGSWKSWLTAFIAGAAAWTLVEYILHRFVLHHVPYIKEMHEAHHDDQTALIGTPIWISLALMIAFVLLPLSYLAEREVAVGLACGLMLGHFWYGSVHHILHHWNLKQGGYFYRLKRRHMLHHHFDEMGNFGVTTGFWDVVFGTDIKVRVAGAARVPARQKEEEAEG